MSWALGPFAFVALGVLALLGVWYLRAVARLARRERSWPASRTVAFVAGLVAVDLALQSPVATLAMSDFSSHVLQHMLLMLVAPPLLALGAPATLVLQTSRPAVKARVLKVLHSSAFGILSHPIVVWFLYYGIMFVFFLSPLLGFAMSHMAVMDVLNLVFLGGGTLFWWPMVSPDPIPSWRMGYGVKFLNLLIGVPFESFLGIALMTETSAAAPMYSVSGTHAGGGLLWAVGELAIAVAMYPIYRQWIRSEEREGRRADRRSPAHMGDNTDWAAAWQARTGRVPTFLTAPESLASTVPPITAGSGHSIELDLRGGEGSRQDRSLGDAP